MNEFELIRRYFSFSAPAGGDIGVGDDCALITPAAGHQLAVTTDTLVEGVHFPADADPDGLARRALRVNLSDLAAMGAEPVGATLAITLPEVDEAWLEAFGAALAEDCQHYGCPLLGGDTTRGPLSLTPTLLGRVPRGEALLRSGATAGDYLYVTGTLGDARAALDCLQAGDTDEALLARYWFPSPRLAVGVAPLRQRRPGRVGRPASGRRAYRHRQRSGGRDPCGRDAPERCPAPPCRGRQSPTLGPDRGGRLRALFHRPSGPRAGHARGDGGGRPSGDRHRRDVRRGPGRTSDPLPGPGRTAGADSGAGL